jgi:RHS repeat-associated protein
MSHEGPFGDIVEQSGDDAEDNPWRFSSKYWDDDTGLGYWGYRWYSVEVARWCSRDPAAEDAGLNAYAFVSNNAVDNKDWLGLIDLNSQEAQVVLDALQEAEDAVSGTFMYAETGADIQGFLQKLRAALRKVRKIKFINKGSPSYRPFSKVMKIPRNADVMDVIHELIHAYNDLMNTPYQGRRADEGMAWTVDACMWRGALQFARLEREGLAGKSCQEIYTAVGAYWRSGWDKADFRDATGSYRGLFGAKRFALKASDVEHVKEALGFKLDCGEMAAHYNRLLWKRGCCAMFSCNSTGVIPSPPPEAGGDVYEAVFWTLKELPRVYR